MLLKGEKLSFDGNVFLLFHCWFRFFLRNKQFQNAMFKLSLNILLLNILAYIKASAAGSCVTLPADVMTGFFLLLIFVQTFLSADGQVAILQGSLNLIFGKS